MTRGPDNDQNADGVHQTNHHPEDWENSPRRPTDKGDAPILHGSPAWCKFSPFPNRNQDMNFCLK
ncbi:hypothetical protein BH23PLA1_BH23PLA1_12370 [soil metagenome]